MCTRRKWGENHLLALKIVGVLILIIFLICQIRVGVDISFVENKLVLSVKLCGLLSAQKFETEKTEAGRTEAGRGKTPKGKETQKEKTKKGKEGAGSDDQR